MYVEGKRASKYNGGYQSEDTAQASGEMLITGNFRYPGRRNSAAPLSAMATIVNNVLFTRT